MKKQNEYKKPMAINLSGLGVIGNDARIDCLSGGHYGGFDTCIDGGFFNSNECTNGGTPVDSCAGGQTPHDVCETGSLV